MVENKKFFRIHYSKPSSWDTAKPNAATGKAQEEIYIRRGFEMALKPENSIMSILGSFEIVSEE